MVELAVQFPRDLLMLALGHLVVTDRVYGAAFGDCHQPSTGIGWNADPGPFGQGNDQGTSGFAHRPAYWKSEFLICAGLARRIGHLKQTGRDHKLFGEPLVQVPGADA